MYIRAVTSVEALSQIRDLSPRTVLIDVEPLAAYWDTDVNALDQGINFFLDKISALDDITIVGFTTNSRRQPTAIKEMNGVSVFYESRAYKPFRTAIYKELPRPGVVIGDQIATDGLLSWRLGYNFVHYCPPIADIPIGPRLMSLPGRLIKPMIFRSEESAHP